MIATHNIKVNGRWIRAGERYGEEKVQAAPAAPEETKAPEAPEVPEATAKAEPEQSKETPKVRSTTRRKVSK